MRYTRERLEHALHVYREAKRLEKHCSSFSQVHPRHLRSEYSFRRLKTTRIVKHTSGWNGEDSSSDEADEYSFDITKKRRKLMKATTQPAKRVKRASTSSPTQRPQHPTESTTDNCTASAPFITLSLSSKKEVLTGLIEGKKDSPGNTFVPFNLPSGDDGAGTGRLTSPANQQFLERLDEQSAAIDNENGRRLRNNKFILDQDRLAPTKKCFTCMKARTKCERSKTGLSGCKRCHKNGIECQEEDIAVKNAALGNAQEPTEAVPAEIPTPSQIIRSHVASLQHHPQITNTRGPDSTSIFGLGTSREKAIVLDSSPSPELSPKRPPASSARSASQLSSVGRLVTIRTHWAHPIDFKHKPTEIEPCHFCNDFRYGIYGYGELEVEMIRFPNSAEYIEAGTGHRSLQHEPTRMCTICSLSRLYISRCKVHILTLFSSPSQELQVKYYSQLLSLDWQPENPSLKTGALRTCSLCPRAAVWRCGADQRFDKVGRPLPTHKGKGAGCGLILCDSCKDEVGIDGMLRRRSVEQTVSADHAMGRRADVDFLFAGSLLHKAYA